MKRMFFAVLMFSLLVGSCGSGTEEAKTEVTVPKGMMSLDLSQYGINASIIVPDSTVAPLEVNEQSSGELEIMVGTHFQIMIAQGGDLVLKKSDLEGDLLYKSSILSETPSSLVYKSELPDGSMTFHHFYSVFLVDGIQFEAKDIDNGEPLPQKAVEDMLAAVNGLIVKAKPQS